MEAPPSQLMHQDLIWTIREYEPGKYNGSPYPLSGLRRQLKWPERQATFDHLKPETWDYIECIVKYLEDREK